MGVSRRRFGVCLFGLPLGWRKACAAEALVVIVHPHAPIPSTQLITDLFLGRSAVMRPVDLPPGSSTSNDFYRRLTGRDPAYARSIWAQQLFTGRGRPPEVMPDIAKVLRAVAEDPKAIGYVGSNHLDGRVKVALTLP